MVGYRCPMRISPRQTRQADSLWLGVQENHPLPQKRKKAAVPEKRNRPLVALRRSTTRRTTRSLPDLHPEKKELLRWPTVNIPVAIMTGTIGATGSMRRM